MIVEPFAGDRSRTTSTRSAGSTTGSRRSCARPARCRSPAAPGSAPRPARRGWPRCCAPPGLRPCAAAETRNSCSEACSHRTSVSGCGSATRTPNGGEPPWRERPARSKSRNSSSQTSGALPDDPSSRSTCRDLRPPARAYMALRVLATVVIIGVMVLAGRVQRRLQHARLRVEGGGRADREALRRLLRPGDLRCSEGPRRCWRAHVEGIDAFLTDAKKVKSHRRGDRGRRVPQDGADRVDHPAAGRSRLTSSRRTARSDRRRREVQRRRGSRPSCSAIRSTPQQATTSPGGARPRRCIVLMIAFGSVVAVGLPLITALFGFGISSGGLIVLVVNVIEVRPEIAVVPADRDRRRRRLRAVGPDAFRAAMDDGKDAARGDRGDHHGRPQRDLAGPPW